jgi:hypothetical protein
MHHKHNRTLLFFLIGAGVLACFLTMLERLRDVSENNAIVLTQIKPREIANIVNVQGNGLPSAGKTFIRFSYDSIYRRYILITDSGLIIYSNQLSSKSFQTDSTYFSKPLWQYAVSNWSEFCWVQNAGIYKKTQDSSVPIFANIKTWEYDDLVLMNDYYIALVGYKVSPFEPYFIIGKYKDSIPSVKSLKSVLKLESRDEALSTAQFSGEFTREGDTAYYLCYNSSWLFKFSDCGSRIEPIKLYDSINQPTYEVIDFEINGKTQKLPRLISSKAIYLSHTGHKDKYLVLTNIITKNQNTGYRYQNIDSYNRHFKYLKTFCVQLPDNAKLDYIFSFNDSLIAIDSGAKNWYSWN